MLKSINTRPYLPEAARAATASPCGHTVVWTVGLFGDQPALAHQPMR
jgi:hypothetical protein